MDRPASRRGLLFLLLVATTVSLVIACTDESGPVEATLAELVAQQEEYEGRPVETGGAVRRFGPEEGATRLHYVVEDKDSNRVALVPNDVAERYTGREVVVVGVFSFSEDEGRRIRIERIEER